MLNFIKVEDYDDGEEIRINAEHIVKYTSYNWGATIQFVNGKSLEVRNTIEEIDEMIENINKKWEK